MLKLFSITARIFVIAVPNIIMMLYVYSLILKKKRSLGWAYAWSLGKFVVHSLLVQWIFGYYYEDTWWWNILNVTIVCTTGIFNFIVFFWTYAADYLKTAVVTALGEIPWTFLLYFCIGVVNLLERREDMWAYGVEFQILDLLIPVLEFWIVLVFCRLLAPFFQKIRNHRIVHRKLMWMLIGGYIFCASASNIRAAKTARGACAIIVFCSVSAVIGMTALVYRYSESLKKEKEFLTVKQRLGQTHYEMIKKQIRQIEQSQQVIDKQMVAIMEMEEFDSETVSSYMEQIKRTHEEICVGIYCDDWVIDALLYSQVVLFQKNGIQLRCSMQGYMRGEILESDIIQILTVLLGYAGQVVGEVCEESKEKVLLLEMTTIKKQLVIEMSMTGNGKDRLLKRKLKPYLKKYDGTFLAVHESEWLKVVVTLKTERRQTVIESF